MCIRDRCLRTVDNIITQCNLRLQKDLKFLMLQCLLHLPLQPLLIQHRIVHLFTEEGTALFLFCLAKHLCMHTAVMTWRELTIRILEQIYTCLLYTSEK